MKKFDRGGDVYGTINVVGQRPSAGNFGGNIFGGSSGSQSGWSVPTAGTGRPMTEEEADAFARKFYEGWDPYGGQSVVDREAELNALLAEQGYLEDVNKPYGELPVFLTDLIGEYPTIGGNIIPGDQGTAVVPPKDDTLFDLIGGGTKDAVTAVGGVIDTGLKQLGDLIGMGDPSLVVLNPVNPTASVVYGTPTGSATPTIIGNMPKSGAPIGVITGIPALDNILSGVFSQRGQGGASVEEIIRGVVLDQIGKETGYPVAGVAGAAGGGLSGDLNKGIDSVGKVVLQIDKKVEAADNDPFSIIKGPSPDGQMEPIKTVATGEDMRIGGGGVTGSKENQNKVTPTSGIPTGEDMLIGGGEDTKSKENKVTPTPPTPEPPKEPPSDVADEVTTILGETPEPETVTSTPSTPGAPSTPTPLYGLGVRSMKTEKAGVTPLEDVFDIGDMSLANVLRLLAGEDDNTQGTPYYGGGSVNRANSVDELIRLLRG